MIAKRFFLLVGQLIVGLAMVPEAVLFGAVGTLPFLGDVLTARAGRDIWGPGQTYARSMVVASFAVDAAAVLCLISAVLLMWKPSRRGVWLSIAGTTCYWTFIVAHLGMMLSLPHGRRIGLTLWDGADYLLGFVSALVTFGLYSYTRTGLFSSDTSQPQPKLS